MFLFFLGLAVGVIIGITLMAVLSSGSAADEQIEYIFKNLDQFYPDEQKILIPKP